jgi:hypothetical protein
MLSREISLLAQTKPSGSGGLNSFRYHQLTPSFLAMAWQLVVSYPLTKPLLSIQKPVLSFSRQMVQRVQ